ncbi:MAG TPA: DNA mismatch repair endonuclease MutL [Candidatus Acidoferrales bacterium]|nr:DNA mismatch repair endonuclease MutL [Candidatus Acidoferrales bacterium]
MIDGAAVGIRVLDEITVGQIAAGEVVERPLSVVKELVENALDAGASRVTVAIEHGGLQLIDVSDDGAGISREQLVLAPRRHATSKLRDAVGLESITTLGFRGEGLAAIAAVGRMRIISRPAGEEVAHAVDAFELTISDPVPLAAPVGTRVIVRDLFANVPVRREYMRSASAEFARISTFLATLSLRYPQVTFALRHDGREAWIFPASPNIEQRLAYVFGVAAARALVALDAAEGEQTRVSGFISKPGNDRPDRRMQILFINGRLLRSQLLAGAWTAGYATFAMTHRQPYGVLFLDLPPEHVDANVHPTKSDVRLRHAQRTGDIVKQRIAATLKRLATERLGHALSLAPPVTTDQSAASAPTQRSGAQVEPLLIPQTEIEPAAPLRILAQLDDTFILATDGAALILIDQHAAHERVAFEAIERRARLHAPGEPLLVPYVVEFNAEDAAQFEASRQFLCEAGLEVEPFGERTYRVTATPAGYAARPFNLHAYLEDLADVTPGLDARERAWASLACHSVVRAGERLEHDEMAALVAQLERCANPMHCPHGRPTIVRIESDELARLFKRA